MTEKSEVVLIWAQTWSCAAGESDEWHWSVNGWRYYDRFVTFVHVKDHLRVMNCAPRRVNDDGKIFAKFVWINNAKHILRETSQSLKWILQENSDCSSPGRLTLFILAENLQCNVQRVIFTMWRYRTGLCCQKMSVHLSVCHMPLFCRNG